MNNSIGLGIVHQSMGESESKPDVLVMENCLLADVPYFDWLSQMDEAKYVELFPGIYLEFNAPWVDKILKSTVDSEVAYHLIKAAEHYSKMTCNGVVCELVTVHEEIERFLSTLELKFEYFTPPDLTGAVFHGASLLMLNDISPSMKKIISFDGGLYNSLNSTLEVVNESLIKFSKLDPKEITIIDKAGWQGFYQKWIWSLVFVFIKYKPKDRMYRFLSYCGAAKYHKNAFSALMNYYSAIESIFGFSGKNLKKNLIEFAPLLCEKSSGEITQLIQTCLNNASKLRNVHAHGNKVREKYYSLLHQTESDMEVIAQRLLRGIIDIGYVPSHEDLIAAKNEGLHMLDWSEIHRIDHIESLSWSNVPTELYDFEKVIERYQNLWL